MVSGDFTAEQQLAVEKRESNILVAAAAGSGKTHVLVSRLMSRVCDEHRDIDEFLIITYTRAAASELRARILSEIGKRLREKPNRHLMRQQTLIHRAKINTIHAFCQSILRENAHIVGIAPDFRIAEGEQAQMLVSDVLERLLSERYDDIENQNDFRALADTMGGGRDDKALCDIILQTRSALLSHPYPELWTKLCVSQWELEGIKDASETVWGKYIIQCEKRNVQYWLAQMNAALDTIYMYPQMEKAYADSYEKTVAALRTFSEELDKNWDAASKVSKIPFSRIGALRKFEDKELAESVKDVRERCRKAMAKTAERMCADTAALAEDMHALAPVIRELFAIVQELESAVMSEKHRKNILDFSDLEHLALKLLVNSETGECTEIAETLKKRFVEIMVDEYQDVNAVQDMIFSAVSDKGNLFMVGDVKQSIYRFRLADPSIFMAKYKSYDDASENPQSVNSKILLSSNFRSRKGVLDAVNFVFSNIMSEDFGAMEYTNREALHPGAQFQSEDKECIELLVLDAADSEDESRIELEARLAANRVEQLLQSGTTISDGGNERALRSSDIMLLLRSPKGREEIYAEALRSRGIAAQTDKKGKFFDTLEISVIISLLYIIDNAHQDVHLIAVLRSPLFGFTADELAAIRLSNTHEDMYFALKERARVDERCANFLKKLELFRLLSADMQADELIWRIYLETNATAVFGAMHAGQTREKNLLLFYEYARELRKTGRADLFSFLDYIRRLIERGKEPEIAGFVSESSNAVTITSIHKSKGLEAPIVLLCDTSKKFNTEDINKPLLIHSELGAGPWRVDIKRRIKYPTLARMAITEKLREEMLFEELRVLYVAMTRAKEKLIVTCSYKNAQRELERLSKTAELPVQPQVLRECRSMSDWLLSVALCRNEAQCLSERVTTHYETQDNWLIEYCRAYELQSDETKNEEQPSDLAMPAESKFVETVRENLLFVYPYRSAQFIPSKLTATELKGSFVDKEANEQAEPVLTAVLKKQEFRVPDFAPMHALTPAERGTAAHLAMQYIKYEYCTCQSNIKAELERMVNMKLLSAAQAESVDVEQILRLFSSQLGKRILNADKVMREFKFSVLRPASDYYPNAGNDSVLLQGVVDCCIEENGELTVIDYKTDFTGSQDVQEYALRYQAQLETYASALEEISGKKVREKIVYFLRTGKSALICAKS